ncbi:ATP synthase subunit I [Pandoraea sp.]|uniref:N-ATPase subunit AtpR n=1 Tax=Pandoraea sp. TaxID=1883445 RepID=UPI0025D23B9E|nr:ATP synthase subunit I [Pandoraea sp.]
MITSIPAQLPAIVAGSAAGWLAGMLHFATLRQTVRLFTAGAAGKALLLQAGRLALLALIFFVLARFGAWVLLGGAAGLLLARRGALRRNTREAAQEVVRSAPHRGDRP